MHRYIKNMCNIFFNFRSGDLNKKIAVLLPTIVYIISYFFTTVLAATIYLIPGGDSYIKNRNSDIALKAYDSIGSLMYLFLLYAPIFIVPLVSWLAIRFLSSHFRILSRLDYSGAKIHTMILWGILVVSVLYSFSILFSTNALDFSIISSGDYVAKTTHRLNILESSGFVFFAFAYGINLIIPVLAFIAYVKQGEKLSDLLLFIIAFIYCIFIITATYSKAQILIYLIMMWVAFILTRAKLKYMLLITLISGLAFLLTGYLMASAVETQNTSISPHSESRSEVITFEPAAKWDVGMLMSYLTRLTGDVPHRMAAAVPFYVVMFKDESERCGIQGNLVRKVLHLPEAKCVLPIKVFNAMYPEVDWAQGQQPAPATLSAYGELGILWFLCVMILCGISLGILSTIGAAGTSPIFLGFTVAVCSFSYYLTQVSIVASFTYPHGIFVFMIPIAILLLGDRFKMQ